MSTSIQVVGAHALHAHAPARDGAGDQVGAALDAVRQHFVGGPPQPLDPVHHDLVGAGAVDGRAHGDEKVGEIDDLGLARCVLDDRLALGERRRHHQVLGAGHRHGVEHQPRALQARGTRADITALDGDVGAHRLQPRHVDVDRTGADRAAARKRHVGAPVARHQGTEHQDRGAHGLHQVVGREALAHRRAVDLDAHALVDRDGGAHPAEELDGGGDVLQVRHVRDHHRIVREQRPGEDRQCGVLGAGDAHLAFEGGAALDLEFIHAGSRVAPVSPAALPRE
jgi:hypothetical protein